MVTQEAKEELGKNDWSLGTDYPGSLQPRQFLLRFGQLRQEYQTVGRQDWKVPGSVPWACCLRVPGCLVCRLPPPRQWLEGLNLEGVGHLQEEAYV